MMMDCIHCGNVVGEQYVHHVKGKSWCGECGVVLGFRGPEIVKYLGITLINGVFVHLYDRLTPLSCRVCGTRFWQCHYDCAEDGAAFSVQQLQSEETS